MILILRMGEKSTNGGRLHMFDGGVEKIAFYTDGTDNHISAGNVGIGTSSIDEKLQVVIEGNIKIEGGANSSTVGLKIAHTGQTGNTTNLVQNSTSSNGHLFTTDRRLIIEAGSNRGTGTAETLDLQFVNGSERMMIDTTGRLGVGIESSPQTEVHIAGTNSDGSSTTLRVATAF